MKFIFNLIPKLKNPVSIALMLICMTTLVSDYHFRWKDEQWKYTLSSDAAHYYRYLPMVLINHHLDDQAEDPNVVKYYIGTSLFYAPFFGMAYLMSMALHAPLDGYSLWFMVFVSVGTLFYLLWGLHSFSKFLRLYRFPDGVISLVITALALSTVAYYTVLSPGWSHIVAFSLITFSLYHVKKYYSTPNPISLYLVITAISFLFFVRPSDVVIVILFPFLGDGWRHFSTSFKHLFEHKRTLFLAIITALLPLIGQLLIYKHSLGTYLAWSYKGEGFDFLSPELFKVLFSYSKGLFVYAPICFFSLLGLGILFRKSRHLFWGVILYLTLNVYIISSWWCWNYGWSFGPRAFIEHFPVFFLLLAFILNQKNRLIKTGAIGLMIMLSALNIFQMYQAEQGILDVDFKTDSKGFWNTFLTTDHGYSGKYYRYPVDERPENILRHDVFETTMETEDTTWQCMYTRSNEKAHSGTFSSKVKKLNCFSVGIYKKMDKIPYGRNVLIRVSAWFNIAKKGSQSYFALSFSSQGKSFDYYPFKMDLYADRYGVWEYHVFEIYMPKFSKKTEQQIGNQFECYLYNDSEVDCFIDDLKIEFIEFQKMERVLDNSWDL